MSTRKRAVLTRKAIGDGKLRNSRTIVIRTIDSGRSELPPMPAGRDDRATKAAGTAELAGGEWHHMMRHEHAKQERP